MAFAVLSDTSGNIPKKLLEEKNIPVIPFVYSYDGEDHVCEDVENFDAEEFYSLLARGKVVTTTQISPSGYADFFRPFLNDGLDVIFVSMSSGISGSYNSANIAASILKEEFPERQVAVIDTKGAALGEGFVALKGAELRDKGLSFEEAVSALRTYSTRMCNVFTVDDLMFLKRGGRLSNLTALVGTVLNIKPLLKGDETGHIVAFAKIRGRKKAVEALAERYDTLVEDPASQTVGIVHAACVEDAEKLAELLKKNRPPRDILIVGYEPVTGSHVGPGTLALFFEGRDDVRTALNDMASAKDRLKTMVNSVKTTLDSYKGTSPAEIKADLKAGLNTARENMAGTVKEKLDAVRETDLDDVKEAFAKAKDNVTGKVNSIALTEIAEVKEKLENIKESIRKDR